MSNPVHANNNKLWICSANSYRTFRIKADYLCELKPTMNQDIHYTEWSTLTNWCCEPKPYRPMGLLSATPNLDIRKITEQLPVHNNGFHQNTLTSSSDGALERL